MPDQRRPPRFGTKELPPDPTVTAPDGSHVRELLSLPSGSAAHFELAPGAVSRAGRHRTVDEIWYILAGPGQMWRRDGGREEVVSLHPDLCLTIPAGTSFQFRAIGDSPLSAFAVTMPPWARRVGRRVGWQSRRTGPSSTRAARCCGNQTGERYSRSLPHRARVRRGQGDRPRLPAGPWGCWIPEGSRRGSIGSVTRGSRGTGFGRARGRPSSFRTIRLQAVPPCSRAGI